MLKIKKRKDYKEHNCLLGLGKQKDADFNKGKAVDVSDEEYKGLSNFEWCEKAKGESK